MLTLEKLVQAPIDVAGDETVAPALEIIRSALYGAILFAEAWLEAAGVPGMPLSRMIFMPGARHWTLAFGEHVFEVDVQADGLSVRSLGSSRPACRPSRWEA